MRLVLTKDEVGRVEMRTGQDALVMCLIEVMRCRISRESGLINVMGGAGWGGHVANQSPHQAAPSGPSGGPPSSTSSHWVTKITRLKDNKP